MSNFNEDLLGCFSNFKVCFIGWCCPGGICLLQADAVNLANGNGVLVPYLFVYCFGCIGGAINRGKIRDRYNIEGAFWKDCLIWWICPGCAACQEYREVKNRG